MKIETSTVKRLCKENGTNLKKVAYKLGVPYNTIYAATKRGSCSKEVAEAIASAFDVDVSYICGEPDSAIRKYESGRITPKYQTLKRIANALQTPVYVLIEDKHSGVHGMCENEIDLNKLLNPDDRTRLFRILAEIFDWNFQPGILSSAEIKCLSELLIANGVTFKEEKECPKN